MDTPQSTQPSKWRFVNDAVGQIVVSAVFFIFLGICLAALPIGVWTLMGFLRGWDLHESHIPLGIKVFAGVCVMAGLVVGVIAAIAMIADCRGQWRHAQGRCRECGYDIRATRGRCPECGWEEDRKMIDFTHWPHRWLFFQETVSVMPVEGLPSIAAFRDEGWLPTDKDKLVNYLETAPEMVTSSNTHPVCAFCGEPVASDAWAHSDGVWVWPHGLAHYVSNHCIRLPDKFVSHIRSRSYDASGWDGLDWTNLDWPR